MDDTTYTGTEWPSSTPLYDPFTGGYYWPTYWPTYEPAPVNPVTLQPTINITPCLGCSAKNEEIARLREDLKEAREKLEARANG